MIKLLRANFCRLKKDVLFYLVILANTALTIVFSYNLSHYGIIEEFYLIIQPIAYSVFIAFYIGKEYSNGTIRNKLVCGHTRFSLYFAYLITCIVAVLVSILPGIVIFCIWNFKFLYTIQLSLSVLVLLGYLLLHCAYCAVFVAIGFNISSKAVCVVVVALVAFLGTFVSEYAGEMLSVSETLPEVTFDENGYMVFTDGETKNPEYIDGAARTVLIQVFDFIPQGQISEYCSCLSKWFGVWENDQSLESVSLALPFKDNDTVIADIQYGFFINQISLILISSIIGYWLFHKKSLK